MKRLETAADVVALSDRGKGLLHRHDEAVMLGPDGNVWVIRVVHAVPPADRDEVPCFIVLGDNEPPPPPDGMRHAHAKASIRFVQTSTHPVTPLPAQP
ncbi:MAG: hypothetical protein ACPIOQ_85350 [Promethearchaeia archaeon]